MKTLLEIFFLMAVISLTAGCNKTEDIQNDHSAQLKSAQLVTVEIPFKADFTVWNKSNPADDFCEGQGFYSATMIGYGNITHLGYTTTKFTFCNNLKTGEYWNTDVVFTAANGDELYATIPVGLIIPNDEENAAHYRTRFNDKMYFTGGTGRFEGASGEAMTNAYVHYPKDEYLEKGDEVWHTDFFSEGLLILVKGKK